MRKSWKQKMQKTRRRATTVAVVLGTLGVTGAAQAGGFGGPEYYAGVFAGNISGSGTSHDATSLKYDIPTVTKGTWGLLGGVNFRNGPWLLGGEADYSFGSSRNVSNSQPNVNELKSNNLHLLGRFGYRINKFDLFLTGGYASIQSTGNTYATPGSTATVTLSGYSIGAGADYTVMSHGVVRLQVLQDKYGSKDFGNGYGIDDWKDTTIRAAAVFQF
jgi:outer membrane immunogenic protein